MSKVTTFGTSQRGSIIRKSAYVPAPNHYSTAQRRKVRGQTQMKLGKRANSVQALTPGPGHYEPKVQRAKGVTILERHNLAALLKEKLMWPGPQSYD